MTGAHRPTFDHAMGKEKKISSSITHKRAHPSHSKLKFRNKKQKRYSEFEESDTDHKLEHENDFKTNELIIKIPDSLSEHNGRRVVSPDSMDDNSRKSDTIVRHSGLDKQEGNEEEIAEESVEESEEESDDEEELLREMSLIKKEREQALLRKKQEDVESKALVSNPLLRLKSEEAEQPQRKSWRVAKPMAKSTKVSQVDRYTNDTLKSDYHKEFLDKYVKN